MHASEQPLARRWRLAILRAAALRLRSAISLVELLVAIAIIGTLLALLLPGIQSAREATRVAQCRNNLRELGKGLLLYHDVYRRFPCGGWGNSWIGMPDRANGPNQPGGWAYATLPFLEEAPLHDLGNGLDGNEATDQYSRRLQTPLPLFSCPSRRSCQAWPIAETYSSLKTPKPFGNVEVVARGDYAINAGTSHCFAFGGPADLPAGGSSTYWQTGPTTQNFNGISHLRKAAVMHAIVDGTSKTYLIGEKHVPIANYIDGTSPGDSASLYAGFSYDLYRFSGVLESLKIGRSPFSAPLNDKSKADNFPPEYSRFGSAHAAGVNMTYCDGSVQFVDYDIDPEVHLRAGHRADLGNPLETLN